MAVGDLFGSMSGWNFGWVTTFIQWLFFPMVAGFGMYAIWWFLSYKVRVHIHDPTGLTNSLGSKDKGKKVRDRASKSIKGFRLLRNNKDYSGSPVDERFFQPVKRLFGIGYELHMVRDDKGNLQPILPPGKKDVRVWEGMTSTDVAWAVNEARSAIRAYASKDDKWSMLQNAAPYIGLAFVVVLMIVLLRQMDGVVAGLNGVATQLGNINVAEQVIS